MSGLRLLLGKEMREQVRTLRLPVVLVVFAILGLMSPLVARYVHEIIDAVGGGQLEGVIPDPVVGDAVVQFTKNVGQFGVVIAILVTMGAVAGEKDHGTAAFLLTKPLTRGAFLAAKVVAIGVLLALGIALAGLLCWVYTAILFAPLPIGGYVAAMVLVWLSLAVFAAITFLASVAARSSIVAGGIGLGALVVAGILGALPGVGSYLPTSLWGAAEQLALGPFRIRSSDRSSQAWPSWRSSSGWPRGASAGRSCSASRPVETPRLKTWQREPAGVWPPRSVGVRRASASYAPMTPKPSDRAAVASRTSKATIGITGPRPARRPPGGGRRATALPSLIAELRGAATERVIERHDERPLPVAFEGCERDRPFGIAESSVDGHHHLHERVATGHPLGVGQQDGLGLVAVVLRDVPLDERAAVRVEAHPPRSREISSVVVGVPGSGR